MSQDKKNTFVANTGISFPTMPTSININSVKGGLLILEFNHIIESNDEETILTNIGSYALTKDMAKNIIKSLQTGLDNIENQEKENETK